MRPSWYCACDNNKLLASATDGLNIREKNGSVSFLLAGDLAVSNTLRACPLPYIMMDIDFFKKINDNYGHNAGDAVLKELVRRVLAELRPYDTFGRYGGEEFVILLPGAFMYEVLVVSERVRNAIRNTPFPIGSTDIQVTSSFGVAEFDFKENSDALINRADVALYKAKHNGRDRIES